MKCKLIFSNDTLGEVRRPELDMVIETENKRLIDAVGEVEK